jgi:hypothetical protein
MLSNQWIFLLDLIGFVLVLFILGYTILIYQKTKNTGYLLKIFAWSFLAVIRLLIIVDDCIHEIYWKDILTSLTVINIALFVISYYLIDKNINDIIGKH